MLTILATVCNVGGIVSRFERIASRVAARYSVFDVCEHEYTRDGVAAHRPIHTFHTRDWCIVVAITKDGQFPLIRQHRFGTDLSSVELPGGIIDDGESPSEAARRELREETGYDSEDIVSLGTVFANPALQGTRLHMHLARGCTPHAGGQSLDELEDCEPILVDRVALDGMIENGEITHALVFAALFAFQRYELREHDSLQAQAQAPARQVVGKEQQGARGRGGRGQ
ncbi:MAG: hypothetical protein NVS3B20_15220 [Polyangiales bacterium]